MFFSKLFFIAWIFYDNIIILLSTLKIEIHALYINPCPLDSLGFFRNELYNNGPSGTSLIGFGPTAEIMVPKLTEDIITGNGVFLCDMGSQYLYVFQMKN